MIDTSLIINNNIIVLDPIKRIECMFDFLNIVSVDINTPKFGWCEELVNEFPKCNKEGRFIYYVTGAYLYIAEGKTSVVKRHLQYFLNQKLYPKLIAKCRLRIYGMRRGSGIPSINYILPKLYNIDFINKFPKIL